MSYSDFILIILIIIIIFIIIYYYINFYKQCAKNVKKNLNGIYDETDLETNNPNDNEIEMLIKSILRQQKEFEVDN
jgi:uncharacterized protein YpmB